MSNWLKTAIVTGAMAASVAATLPAQADTFIKFDGIAGDAASKLHKGEVSALSWSWGSSSPRAAGSGAATGKTTPQDLTITKLVDVSTTALISAQFTGKRIPKVTLSVETNTGGGTPSNFITVVLTDVLITSYQVTSSGNSAPSESISLNFRTVNVSVFPRDAKGGTGAAQSTGDLGAATKS